MPYYPEKKPEVPEEPKQEIKAAEKRRKLLRLSFAAVSCLLIVYGGVRLTLYLSDLASSRQTGRELREIRDRTDAGTDQPSPAPDETVSPALSPSPVPTAAPAADAGTPLPGSKTSAGDLLRTGYPDNPDLKMSERFRQLRKKGQYIVGWITLDGVDEAVAQKDNTFFLSHDAAGNKNSNGAIFLDSEIRLTTRPDTYFLYGHNMKSGNMFGKLKKYKDSAYLYQHRIITFDTLYEEGQYAVFAVMQMNTVPGTALWYDLWSLDTKNRADREQAIRTLEKRSAVSGLLDVQADDQLLLLVTCLDGDTERMVVAARRLRDDETPDHLAVIHEQR